MLDKLYITPRQWLRILRWTLYAALFLLALLVQTVVFGNRTILGAHPDLVAIVITCVCLREGPERVPLPMVNVLFQLEESHETM